MTQDARELIVLGQNETGRSTVTQSSIYLSTVGLMGCVAVILYSEKTGRISLTHADTKTEMSFLVNELQWVGKESLKVFLIKNLGDLDFLIRSALSKQGVTDVDIKESKEGTVVFNHHKRTPQFFKKTDFCELIQTKTPPNPENILHKLKYQPRYQHDAFVAQKNNYIRQLNSAVSTVCSHSPVLAFDESGWSRFELELASDVISKIEKNDIKCDVLSIVRHVWPRYQHLISQMALAVATGKELNPIFTP